MSTAPSGCYGRATFRTALVVARSRRIAGIAGGPVVWSRFGRGAIRVIGSRIATPLLTQRCVTSRSVGGGSSAASRCHRHASPKHLNNSTAKCRNIIIALIVW